MGKQDVIEEILEEFGCYTQSIPSEGFLSSVAELVLNQSLKVDDIVSELIQISQNKYAGKLPDEVFQSYLSKNEKPSVSIKKENTTPVHTGRQIKTEQDNDIMAAYGGSPITPLQPSKRLQTTPESNSSKKRSTLDGTPKPVINRTPNSKVTPVRRRHGLTPSSPKYTKRNNRLEVIFSHGDTKSVKSWSGSCSDLPVTVLGSRVDTKDFRYMFQKLQDRAHVLNQRIEELTEKICKSSLDGKDELYPVTEVTNSEVYVGGQICCDSEGRLNTESVVLQGSMDTSSGKTIPVNISDLPSYSMFPGQAVILKGTNANGSVLKATDFFTPEPSDTPLIAKSTGLTIMVACGPYTPDDSDDYLPFTDLLTEINKTSPDLVILMGPFVDPSNRILPNSTESYESIFDSLQKKIQEEINLDIHVVVVSSSQDLHHEPVYPTVAYKPSVSTRSNVQYVMDPCTLDINGIRLGLTSTDILFHMASNEVSWKAEIKDRMLRLSQHLFSQRHYFPLYPPPNDINLDLELNEKYGRIDGTPHLFIVSSDLPQFIKVGGKVVVANPGRLCKRSVGGTFMRLLVEPIENLDNVKDHVKAEIIRI